MNTTCTIQPLGDNRRALLETIGTILDRVHEASADYINSTPVVYLTEQTRGKDDTFLSWPVNLDMKDVCALGAVTQAPVGFRGGTDRGKTDVATKVLNGLFGEDGYWRVEINRAMTIDDMIDIDVKKLSESKLSKAISAAKWLGFPARLLDEANRAVAKLNNVLLHLVDGSGFNVRGDLSIPVGMPYRCQGKERRYSFTMVTANHVDAEYAGVYQEDAAFLRRIVLNMDLDLIPVTRRDVVQLTGHTDRRAKSELSKYDSLCDSILTVYESLPESIPFSALAIMFLHYLHGLGTCVRSRSGQLQLKAVPAICEKCHLAKSHPFCGRVGGLTEGLLLWCQEIAVGIAAIRGAKVLSHVRRSCCENRCSEIQGYLGTKKRGEKLYDAFCDHYLEDLSVQGEDVVAAYTLLAPEHVWIDRGFLNSQETYEKQPFYAFGDVAATSWKRMQDLLRGHEDLFAELEADGEIAPMHQSEVETLVTTEDAAMLSVISLLRGEDLNLRFREALTGANVA